MGNVSRQLELSEGYQAWQAHCLECGEAYLLVMSDERAVFGPPFTLCAVCGQPAVYFRLAPVRSK